MANGNPFLIDQGNPLQGLGQLGAAYFQKQRQDEQAASQQQSTQGAFQLLGDAEREQDPVKKRQMFIQAFQMNPKMVSGYVDTLKKQQEAGQVGAEKPATEYQKQKLELDKRSQDLREQEAELRREENINKRKSLENRVKKESMQLDKLERELAADQKGGAVQKMLRDASESSKKASSFARRMIDSAGTLEKLEETIDPTNRVIGYISGGEGITSEAANRLASPEEQSYASAASDFVTAQLRQESGAAIGKDEFDRKYREFFPVPGDSKDQIDSKRERRKVASKDMRVLSGGLYEALYTDDAQQESAQSQQYTEGMTARNPQTGEVLTFRGGSWQ